VRGKTFRLHAHEAREVFVSPPLAPIAFLGTYFWLTGKSKRNLVDTSRTSSCEEALMNELSGYVFAPLREGDIALYRGSGNGLSPILLATVEETSIDCVKRLEHEHALKGELGADWAAQPVALMRYKDRLTLVLEDPGGVPLDRLLGRPLDLSTFLRIAIPIAGALRRVHERDLVHKDIKPANILVDAESGGVWLTGFGIASRLPRERQAPAPPEVIAGTLAYMAPEQTGRMNRSVDSRSDLYAVGITFYEMLTGTLPFTGADPMEWVHCHIARQPMPPDERVAGVPRALSAIVMKLLAKTAEERYQPAAGVEADLRHCLAEWEKHGRIEPFAIGAYDVSDRLLIPEKLYGREPEIDALIASFDRVVANGALELMLVSGYSGIGKSSVVNELHKVLVPPRGPDRPAFDERPCIPRDNGRSDQAQPICHTNGCEPVFSGYLPSDQSQRRARQLRCFMRGLRSAWHGRRTALWRLSGGIPLRPARL
jgi:serine/threonine protein kinase